MKHGLGEGNRIYRSSSGYTDWSPRKPLIHFQLEIGRFGLEITNFRAVALRCLLVYLLFKSPIHPGNQNANIINHLPVSETSSVERVLRNKESKLDKSAQSDEVTIEKVSAKEADSTKRIKGVSRVHGEKVKQQKINQRKKPDKPVKKTDKKKREEKRDESPETKIAWQKDSFSPLIELWMNKIFPPGESNQTHRNILRRIAGTKLVSSDLGEHLIVHWQNIFNADGKLGDDVRNAWQRLEKYKKILSEIFENVYNQYSFRGVYLNDLGVDLDIFKKFILIPIVESRCQVDVQSCMNAIGMFQVTGSTARMLGYDPSEMKDVRKNAEAAAKLIVSLFVEYWQNRKGDKISDQIPKEEMDDALQFVLARYNGRFARGWSGGSYKEYLRGERDLNLKVYLLEEYKRFLQDYVVQKGDTLNKIVQKVKEEKHLHNFSMQKILELNPWLSERVLQVGEKLKIVTNEDSPAPLFRYLLEKKLRYLRENLNYPAKVFAIWRIFNKPFDNLRNLDTDGIVHLRAGKVKTKPDSQMIYARKNTSYQSG